MDTLGTIVPQITGAALAPSRDEAGERLRYLAQAGACGLLVGEPGTGKSWLFSELAGQLRRDGLASAQCGLAGVTGQEIPYLIAGRLGAGCSSRTSSLELWSQLQDHAESAQRMRRRVAFLLDDVDRADESALPALGRLIELFGASGSWLFSARSAGSSGALRVLADRLWLRIELPPLSRQVAQQVLARELAHGTAPARLTPEAVEAAHELAAGRIRRLRQLAELASLTAEAEQRTDITADLIRALGEELAR